ncbi:MAG: methyltransferase [Saprospiraceae bacterium]
MKKAALFRFKQFAIQQDQCAMKVGTDGVLLGVLADVAGCGAYLIFGTGSGLVALMLAQRQPQATVTAVELDEAAALQASENFNNRPFSRTHGVYSHPDSTVCYANE